MKRITTLLLAALFSFSCVAAAHASSNVDVKVKGRWDFSFTAVFNGGFDKDGDRNGTHRNDDNFTANQRIRTQVNFIMSENLQAVLQFEIGGLTWGRSTAATGKNAGGGLGADGVNVETKHAYLDWMVPDTGLHIRMGLQAVALPSSDLGSPLLDDDVAAVVASYKFNDTFALTAFWARPFDDRRNDSGNLARSFDDETDLFGLVLPISLDGATISPYFMYGKVGAASGFYGDFTIPTGAAARGNTSSASAWWMGAAAEVNMFDPLTLTAEFTYGSIGRNDVADDFADISNAFGRFNEVSSRGWYLAATLDYKLDWGTPGIFGWYSSGDKASDVSGKARLGRMPTVHGDQDFTSFGMDGAAGDGAGSGYLMGESVIGTWGLGLQIADVSFIKNLKHTLRFTYYNGTNDHRVVRNGRGGSGTAMWGDAADFNEKMALIGAGADGQTVNYLTTKDHAYEINFDHKYKIYENLAAILELGVIKIDRDEKTWGRDFQNDAAYKAAIAFEFRF